MFIYLRRVISEQITLLDVHFWFSSNDKLILSFKDVLLTTSFLLVKHTPDKLHPSLPAPD